MEKCLTLSVDTVIPISSMAVLTLLNLRLGSWKQHRQPSTRIVTMKSTSVISILSNVFWLFYSIKGNFIIQIIIGVHEREKYDGWGVII